MLASSIWAGAATLASPGLRLLLRYRAARGKEDPARLAERRGVDSATRPSGRLIWLHAASVGETVSILPVLAAIGKQDPDASMLVTTGTVTSADMLRRRVLEMGLNDRVTHRFAPLDVPAWAERFLNHWRPDVACFVESELWPNILAACRARTIPTILINARMSARSFAAWARIPWAARVVLNGFANIIARGEEDAVRLRALGAEKVEIGSDLKFAAAALPADSTTLREMEQCFADRPVFLAASTHPGEEALIRLVHDTVLRQYPDLLTIIVPRHPERGPELAETLHAPRRTSGEPPPDRGLWIADTLGELGLWYRLSHAVFVGRSLLPPGGGQNPLEPARLGRAIATGPYTDNFKAHVAMLCQADALEVTSDVAALADFCGRMLADPSARRGMGERAAKAVAMAETMADDTARTLLELVDRG